MLTTASLATSRQILHSKAALVGLSSAAVSSGVSDAGLGSEDVGLEEEEAPAEAAWWPDVDAFSGCGNVRAVNLYVAK